jgi:integrase
MAVKVREKVKGSGDWWVFIDHQGKRRAKRVGKDKRFAQEVAKKIEARQVLGDLDLKQEATKTFGEYATLWINTTVPAACKTSTIYDYRNLLKRYILHAFGDMSIRDVNRMKIKQFLTDKIEIGKSASTVNHMKSAISGILNLAVDDETIEVNPAHRLGKIFRVKRSKESIDPLTRKELTLLLDTFREN